MNENKIEESPKPPYGKIRGWLILPAIGLIVNPVRLLILVAKDLWPEFSGETWTILTTPGTRAYHPLWGPVLIFELVGNIVFVIGSILIAVFFFQKRKFVPKLIIVFLLSNLAFVAVDHLGANAIPFIANQSDAKSLKEIVRVVIACSIWVPYFLRSKRVKGTFIR